MRIGVGGAQHPRMVPRWLPPLAALAAAGCALAAEDTVAIEGQVLKFDEVRACWDVRREVVAELPESEAFCGELTQCAIRPADGAPVLFQCTWGDRLGWETCPRGTLSRGPACPGP